MTDIALKTSQLTVTYGNLSVLWDISLTVPKEELVGIIGPNGAGKSTFLKASMGLVKPLSGNVYFPHTDRHKIAYVPQKNAVDWDFPISVFIKLAILMVIKNHILMFFDFCNNLS